MNKIHLEATHMKVYQRAIHVIQGKSNFRANANTNYQVWALLKAVFI